MSKLVGFINKIVTHNRDDEGDFGIRVVLHIPVGIVMSVPVFGWGLIALFIFYEKNEDFHVVDEAWKDTFGAMVGFVIGLAVQLLILCSLVE